MADNNNNNNNDQIATDSYLPLLFANGYPTSLENMSREHLELFIPFLFRCSKHGSRDDSNSKPAWWPNTVEFVMPLVKPKNYKKNWENELRKLVEKCYQYHNHPFLLKYSKDLCKYEPANLRYVTASESTTSLYSRVPKKLLLTFRNENMLYDKKKRMTLWKKEENQSSTPEQDENEATFDIMLCDNCDAEFYSEEAFSKHEKKCGSQMTELEHPIVDNIVISDDDDDDEVSVEVEEETSGNGPHQSDFMAYFFLKSATSNEIPKRNNSLLERSLSPKKKKKPNQRNRFVTNKKEKDLERLIPISSPAGAVLTKKALVSDLYIEESMENLEKHCPAKPFSKFQPRLRQRLQIVPETTVIKEIRKSKRQYSWPKRTLRSLTKETNFEFLNRSLIEETQNCYVSLPKLTPDEIRFYKEKLERLREDKALELTKNCVDLVSDSESDSVQYEDDMNIQSSSTFQGNFITNLYGESIYDRIPLSSVPNYNFLPSTIHFGHDHFSPYHNESNSTEIFPQFSFSQSSVPMSNVSGMLSRKRENDDQGKNMEMRSIRNWIQNVNGENFSIVKQSTFVNTN